MKQQADSTDGEDAISLAELELPDGQDSILVGDLAVGADASSQLRGFGDSPH